MYHESAEDKIRRLEEDVYRARRTIFDLLPPEVKEVAERFWHLTNRREAHEWQSAVADAAIEIAWPLAQDTRYSGTRAYCPLCRRGTSSFYQEGFKLPDGLRKHLLGEGNAHQCDVIHAVFTLARGVWGPTARKAEAEEEATRARLDADRRAIEDLYTTDPRSEPELIDQYLGWGKGPRDSESMKWAMARLEQLGFSHVQEDRVSQFRKDYGPVVVYADPREMGRITFRIFRREQVENPKSRKRWSPDHDSFYLQDTWKKHLLQKLDQRIAEATPHLVRSGNKKTRNSPRGAS